MSKAFQRHNKKLFRLKNCCFYLILAGILFGGWWHFFKFWRGFILADFDYIKISIRQN